jgi:hypothetical protein
MWRITGAKTCDVLSMLHVTVSPFASHCPMDQPKVPNPPPQPVAPSASSPRHAPHVPANPAPPPLENPVDLHHCIDQQHKVQDARVNVKRICEWSKCRGVSHPPDSARHSATTTAKPFGWSHLWRWLCSTSASATRSGLITQVSP